MLRSHFEDDEIIYLYRSCSGNKYSKKDNLLFVIGILFAIIAIASLILAFMFTIKLILICILCSICASGMIGYYVYINKLAFLKNQSINLEYAITNRRFIVAEKTSKKVFDFPITSYYKVLIREKQKPSSKAHLILRKNPVIHNHIPLHIQNENIGITNDGVIIYNVDDAFLLKYQLEFLFNVIHNNIKDIYNPENFLDVNEHVVYTEEFKISNNLTKPVKPNILKTFLICYPIIFVLGFICDCFFQLDFILTGILSLGIELYVLILVFKGKLIAAEERHKNNNIYIKYVITNKRILFFDFANLVLYGFEFKYLNFVNISNYNDKTNTGDIYLTNYDYSVKLKLRHFNGSSTMQQYDLLFPPNYLQHSIIFDFDVMNCSKIRLYNVKSPQQIVNKYIQSQIMDDETIEKTIKKKHK